MNTTSSLIRMAAVGFATFLSTANAAEIFKADNNNNLNLGSSWTNGAAPGPGDLATWNGTYAAANRTSSLGGDLSWGGLRIGIPGGNITLLAGNTLTLGTNGIIMTNSSVNLVLNNNVELGASQVWNGASSRTLTLNGVVSGAAGNTLTKAGANRADLAAANTFAGDVIVNNGQLRVVHPSGLGNTTNIRVNTSTTGSAQDSGTQLALGTNVAPSGVTLTMACTTTGGDFRTTLECAPSTAGFSSGWNGPIVLTGNGSVQFNNNDGARALIIGGNITASNFTGQLKSRGSGSNAFLGTINIPSGTFYKHESTATLINSPGNNWLSTFILNGWLKIGANNALPPNAPVEFGNNGTFTRLDLAGFSQQVGGLSINPNSAANNGEVFSSSTTTDSTLIFNGTGATSFPGFIDDNEFGSPGTPHMNLTIAGGVLALLPTARPNSYSGTTTVNGGASLTVKSDQSGGGPVVVANGGTFGVKVAGAGSSLAVSSATFGTSSGCTLNLDLGSFGNPTAPPIAAGGLTPNGTVTINVQGTGLLQGQFPLISYSSPIGGAGFSAFTLGPLPIGVVSAYLSNNTTSVDLVIELAAGAKLWTGANGTNWDINITTNWTNLATSQPDAYRENAQTGDLATFDDTSSLQTVNLATNVKPAITTFSNNLPYTVSGSGAIYGAGSLVKGSPGTLTLNLSNSFSGGTRHYEGVIQVGHNAAFGSGTVTFPTAGAVLSSASTAAHTLANNLVFAANTTLGDSVNSGILTFSGGINLNNAARDLTFNSDVVWTGVSTNGRINKLGPGTLTIKGLADWNGTLEVRNGALTLQPGGDLKVQAVQPGGAFVSQFNFDGGVLRAKTNNSAFMQGLAQVSVLNGGAIIDSAGFDITIAQALLAGGTGGLTKSGAGTLTLTGTNSYTGTTVVNAGKLVIAPAHAGGGAITVSDGTTLGVLVNVGGSTLNASSLNLGSSGTSEIEFDFSNNPNPATALLNGGTVTANGSVKIDIKGSLLTPGVIPLLKYSSLAGGGYGAFSLGSVPRGLIATLQNNTGTSTIELNISAVDSLIWSGVNGNNWDINTTTNWTLSGSPTIYLDGDATLFNDTASGTTTVNLITNVSPLTVTVSNVAKAYTLQGTIGIGGATTFTKSGSGLLTVATPNTYSGLTTISAGQFKLGTNNVLPDGAGKGSLIVNGTLDLNGFSDGVNGLGGVGIVDNSGVGASALTAGNGDSFSTFSGKLQNSGGPLSLVKVGFGTVQLNGTNTHSGGVTINAGTLQIASGAALGTGQITMGGGTLALPGPLTITNRLAFSANNSHLTNLANTGVMVFTGGIDFLAANRYIYFDNDTTLTGSLVGTGGIDRKFGFGTLKLQGVTGDLPGNPEIREGDVIFDGVTITKSSGGIRLMCTVLGGLGRLVLTNGASIIFLGSNNALRVGSDGPNGEPTATNIADIAGTLQLGPEGATGSGHVVIGAHATLCVLNLWPGGLIRTRGATPEQSLGGNISEWNFHGGTLRPLNNVAAFFQGLSQAYVHAGGAVFDTAGYDITVNQDLLAPPTGPSGGLTKLGLGTLLLNGSCTYTGSTVISNGVLGGNGAITGPLVVAAGGTLSPGSSIGTLTVMNSLTLNPGSTMLVEVDAGAGVSDLIQSVTTANYGGTLQVANLGGPLAPGQSFNIVSAGNGIGNFGSIVPSPGSGLAWSFNPTNGMLSVVTAASNAPTNLTYTVAGGQITLAWPDSYKGWYLQVQTNPITVGLSNNWVTLPNSSTTNSVTFPVDAASGTVFYRMSLQP